MPHRRIEDPGRLQRLRHDIARLVIEKEEESSQGNLVRVREIELELDQLGVDARRAESLQKWPLPAPKRIERRKR